MKIEDVRIGDRVLYLNPKGRCIEPKRVMAISTCFGGVHKVALAHSNREEFDDPDLKSSYLIYADPSMLFPENRPEVLDNCLRDFQHYLKQQIKAHYREQSDLLHWVMCELCKENDTKGTLLEGEQCLRTLSKKALAMDFTFVDDFGVCTQDPFKAPAKPGYYWVVLWRVPNEGSALQRRVFETKEAAEDCLAKVQAMGMRCESPVQVWLGPRMEPGIGIYPPVKDESVDTEPKAPGTAATEHSYVYVIRAPNPIPVGFGFRDAHAAMLRKVYTSPEEAHAILEAEGGEHKCLYSVVCLKNKHEGIYYDGVCSPDGATKKHQFTVTKIDTSETGE